MPQEGESFAGALDSLEARCRFETRALYEAEGKEELLGESGVPESLRTWLEESRERALGDGGYRQGARTRLRGQVRRYFVSLLDELHTGADYLHPQVGSRADKV